MRPGEIFLAQFPFGDLLGMKLRPVLLLTGPVGSLPEVVVAYISSVIPVQPLSSDVLIDPGKPEFHSTRLKTLSVLRLYKIGHPPFVEPGAIPWRYRRFHPECCGWQADGPTETAI